jgi:hypothetical protein
VLVGWDGRTAADLTLVSGKISAWRDRASGNHLVQATDSNRPLAGFSTLGRGIAVWGNGSSARLITGSDIAAVKYAYCVATFFAPPSTRSNGVVAVFEAEGHHPELPRLPERVPTWVDVNRGPECVAAKAS